MFVYWGYQPHSAYFTFQNQNVQLEIHQLYEAKAAICLNFLEIFLTSVTILGNDVIFFNQLKNYSWVHLLSPRAAGVNRCLAKSTLPAEHRFTLTHLHLVFCATRINFRLAAADSHTQ